MQKPAMHGFDRHNGRMTRFSPIQKGKPATVSIVTAPSSRGEMYNRTRLWSSFSSLLLHPHIMLEVTVFTGHSTMVLLLAIILSLAMIAPPGVKEDAPIASISPILGCISANDRSPVYVNGNDMSLNEASHYFAQPGLLSFAAIIIKAEGHLNEGCDALLKASCTITLILSSSKIEQQLQHQQQLCLVAASPSLISPNNKEQQQHQQRLCPVAATSSLISTNSTTSAQLRVRHCMIDSHKSLPLITHSYVKGVLDGNHAPKLSFQL